MKEFIKSITQFFSEELMMNMKRISKFTIIYTIMFILIAIGIKYAIPFVVALAIALSLRGVKNKIMKLSPRFSDGIVSMFLTLSIVTIAAILIFIIGYKLATELRALYAYLTNRDSVYVIVNTAKDEINSLLSNMDPFYLEKINELLPKIIGLMTTVATILVQNLLKVVVSIPTAFIIVITTIITTYFFIKDIERIGAKLKGAFSEKGINVIMKIRKRKDELLQGYLKAFGIIMIVVIIYSSIIFKFCGVPYAIVIGIFTGVFDSLPIFGAGLVYGVAGITTLLNQNYKGTFILVLGYIGCVLIRQFLQQQLMSTFLDLHPLVIIIALFLIVTPVGFVGMFYFLGGFMLYDILIRDKST